MIYQWRYLGICEKHHDFVDYVFYSTDFIITAIRCMVFRCAPEIKGLKIL